MKPQDWKKGMTIIAGASAFVIKSRTLADDGWLCECGQFIMDNLVERHGRRPAIYADLSREPVEGELAVYVEATIHPNETGKVFAYGRVPWVEGTTGFFRNTPVDEAIWFYASKADRFAPLSLPAPAVEERAPSEPEDVRVFDRALSPDEIKTLAADPHAEMPGEVIAPPPAPRLCACGQEIVGHNLARPELCADCATVAFEEQYGYQHERNLLPPDAATPEPRELPHPLSEPYCASPWLTPRRLIP